MASTFSSTQSPLVGKYLDVSRLEFSPYGESWGYICYCESFDNNTYTVRNKFGKIYKAKIDQIQKVISITERQKFNIGDVVEAATGYCPKDGDLQTEFCQIISVQNFANDYDYLLKDVKTDKTYNLKQQSILKTVNLMKNKYQIGMYIGVESTEGSQWDMTIVVNNGTIVKVIQWYDRVSYDIRYDTGEIENVLENYIVAPGVKKIEKTAQQLKQDELTFLRDEEQRLLQQLEMVRSKLF
jgi:hypothetical protein